MTVSQTAPRWRMKRHYAIAALNAVVIVVVSVVIYTYEVRHSQRWAVINGFHFSGAEHANVAERELHALLDELRALATLQRRLEPRPHAEMGPAEQSIQDRLARLSAARRDLMDFQEQYRRPLFREKTAGIDTAFSQFLAAFELPTAGRLDATMLDAAVRLEHQLHDLEALNLEAGTRMAGEENQFRTVVEWSLLALFILLAAMAGYVSVVILRRLENALENEATASAQMQKAGARLDAFFSGSPAGLAIVDDDLRCEKWNETLLRFGGRDPNLGECRIVDLLPKAPARSIESAMRNSLETGAPYYNLEIGIKAEPGESESHHWLWSHFPIQAKEGVPEGLGLVVTDISELKDAEEMLRAERNLNAAILQSANALVVVLDRDGWIVRFNRACELLTGYSANEMVGTRVWDRLLREQDIEPVKALFGRLTSEKLPAEYENAWLTRDGPERLIAWNNSVIQDDAGNVELVVAIGVDVTEQRTSARRMEATARDLAMAQRIAGIGSWQWTVATNEEHWSDQLYRSLGLEPGSCPASIERFYEHVHPEDRDSVRDAIASMMETGSRFSMDFRIVRPNGGQRIIHEEAEPVLDDDGKVTMLIGTVQDVTELRSAECRLSRLTESFANAQRIGRIGNWDWDAATREEWWSDEVYRIMGLEPGAVVASYDAFMERVHADDREKAAAAIEAAQDAKACYDTVYRILRPDGEERVLRETGEAVLDAEGELAGLNGTVQDITEQHRAEERLARTAESLANAQRIARLGSWEWDIASGREEWTDQVFRLYGLEPGAFQPDRSSYLDYVHPDDRDAVLAAQKKAVAERAPLRTEYRSVGADGIERIIQAHGEIVLDEVGAPARMAGTVQDITEIRRAETDLHQSEQRFQLAFQLSPGMTAISEIETGLHVDVNDKWVEVMGHSRDEAVGRTAKELGVWNDPDDRARAVTLLKKNGRFRDLEARFRTKSRDLRDILVSAETIPIDGKPHMLIVGHDVTERKRMEQAQRESEELFRSVFDQAAVGIAQARPDGRMVNPNRKFAEILGYSQDELRVLRFHDITHPDDLEADVRDHERLLAGEIPFYTMEKRYVRGDATILWASLTVSLVRHEDGTPKYIIAVVQDIDARKRAEEEARQASRYLDLFFKHSLTAFVLMDRDFNFIRVNDAYARADDMKPEDFPGRNHFDIYPSEAKPLFEQIRDGKEPYQAYAAPLEYGGDPERGVTYWDWTLAPILDGDGEPELMVLSLNDVTERVRAEQALRESEALFRGAFDQAAVGIILTEPDGRFRRANAKTCEILGFPEEELIGMTYPDVTYRDDMEATVNAHAELRKGKIRSIPLEKRYLRKDGTVIWARTTISYMRDEDGNHLGNMGLIEDIDDRKRAEQALADTVQSLAEAQRIGQIGSWELDPASGAITWSDENYRLLGLDPESVEPNMEFLLDMVHPDDREALKARNNRAAFDGVVQQIEYRFIRPDGSTRLLQSRGEVVRDEDGSIRCLRGTVQDVTKRKQAELALQNALERLEEAQRLAHVANWEWNPETNNSIWSQECYRIFDMKPDPDGKPPTHDVFMKFVHKDDRDALERLMAKALESDEPYVTEFRIIRPDGELRHIHERAARYIDDKTGKVSIRGIVQDITDRKRFEEELARLNVDLEQRVEARTAELREAQAELVKRERLATLGQLTATVSHELRNPLGAMRTSMYIVEKKTEGGDDGVTRAIDRVNRNITRCDQIIDELLDYTRIRDLEVRPLQIDEWLGIVLDEQPVPDGVTVRRKFGTPGLRVPADSDRLRRAVINIYDNACHALTDRSDGDRSSGKNWLSIETHAKKDRLEIVISDNGPGIPKDLRDKVFEPLFSTKNFGVGLGLPTVRQIMEQHGGGVVVTSRRGGGAKFALWLPLAREAEAAGL